jgi:hypothetical protein
MTTVGTLCRGECGPRATCVGFRVSGFAFIVVGSGMGVRTSGNLLMGARGLHMGSVSIFGRMHVFMEWRIPWQ